MAIEQPLVVGLGEVLWDMLPAGKQLGGAPANFAYHAQQLGARSAIVSAVGKDALGDEILGRLGGVGLDTQYVAVDEKHPTGTVDVTVGAKGIPSYVIRGDVAWDFIPPSARLWELAANADVVCHGSLALRNETSRETILKFRGHTRPNCLRIFDINLRQNFFDRQRIEWSLENATVLKINDDEIQVLAKMFGYSRTAFFVHEFFSFCPRLEVIALTRGGDGSVLHSRSAGQSEHPGYPPTKLVDTVGAGDAFTAALAVGLLRKDPLDQINDDANRLASFVCSQAGAMPSYSSFG